MNPKNSKPSRNVKILVAACVGLALAAAALFLAFGRNNGLADQPGLFGSRAGLFADINLVAELLLIAGLGVGAFLARSGRIPAHQYNQTSWVLFNTLLVLFIMVVSFSQNVVSQMPADLQKAYGLFAFIHAVFGAAAVCCAVYLILRMNKLLPAAWRIKKWKRLMRITLALYALVGAGGLLIYYVWYLA